MNRFRRFVSEFTRLYKISDAGPLTRRYLVIGVFDGALTVLGITLGAFMAYTVTHDAGTIKGLIAAAIGGTIALGISSFYGAYEVESLEQKRIKHDKDLAMLEEIDNSIHEEASRFAMLWGALIHGLAPIPAGLLPIIPFYLITDFNLALILSMTIVSSLLFITGFQMGRGARTSGIYYGFRLVFAGVVTATVIILLGFKH